MEELNLTEKQKELIKNEIKSQEAEKMRLQRQKILPKDFIPISIIGRGAFGEVRVCRAVSNNEIVAIKKMK